MEGRCNPSDASRRVLLKTPSEVEHLEDSECQRLGILGCCSRATGVLRACCVCCTFAVARHEDGTSVGV